MTDTPAAGATPDGIFAQARATGATIAAAALTLMQDVSNAPAITVGIPGLDVRLFLDGMAIAGNIDERDQHPDGVACLAGMLMGIADAYRLAKGGRA